jgi:hypothetical protein
MPTPAFLATDIFVEAYKHLERSTTFATEMATLGTKIQTGPLFTTRLSSAAQALIAANTTAEQTFLSSIQPLT